MDAVCSQASSCCPVITYQGYIFGALALGGNKSLGVVGSTDSNTTGTFVAHG